MPTCLYACLLAYRTDPHSVVLVHMKEERITDSSKMKKRKEGRALKMMGDYSLMMLSADDAMSYFSESQRVLKKVEDFLWLASTQVSLSAVIVMKSSCNKDRGAGESEEMKEEIEKELGWRMREALGFI